MRAYPPVLTRTALSRVVVLRRSIAMCRPDSSRPERRDPALTGSKSGSKTDKPEGAQPLDAPTQAELISTPSAAAYSFKLAAAASLASFVRGNSWGNS
jgi:hypothetical protein